MIEYGDPRLPLTFWSKVDPSSGDCWVWLGAANSKGYGCFGVQGVSQLAHRVAYSALVGPIPEGLTVDHGCRCKRCVNPSHLEAVTIQENIARAYAQDRPTHCPAGHEYTPENTYSRRRPNGQMNNQCKTCMRDRARARYHAEHPDAGTYAKRDLEPRPRRSRAA